MKSKVLSIYLPQFHTIPENDEWWGEGFTEWTNVKRGKPFYPGHYQPREPLHDDYYDLSDLKVLEKHTRLARKAGISGFCFYHYYFRGKTLLEGPIENYRDQSKEQFPYCLIWANQSWARTWYRASTENKVLLRQTYGEEEDWRRNFYYLLDFFKDDRYIKVDNKPLYIIYIPQDIHCRKQMFSLWQKLAKKHGFDGIYLVAMDTSYGRDSNSNLYNAYMDFEPLSLFSNDKTWRNRLDDWKSRHIDLVDRNHCRWLNRIGTRNAYTYSYLCKVIERKARLSGEKTLPGIFPGWDNTPRKDEAGITVSGSTPLKFRRHLTKMLKIADTYGKEFIFLNAWNEWSEGAYVEADKRYGYAYLRAMRDVLQSR